MDNTVCPDERRTQRARIACGSIGSSESAPCSAHPRHGWFSSFLENLLAGDDQLLQLFACNPFRHEPLRFVHAVGYRYEFTSPSVRAETGRWWDREFQDVYVLPVTLHDLRSGGRRRRR